MAYTINLTDGTIFATIADGTINQSAGFGSGTPLVLVGKNYAGYGEFLDENFIHLLENGASTSAPGAPLIGQLWWDKTNGQMKSYTGAVFKPLGSITSSNSAPTLSRVQGDLWYDSQNAQLKVWTGTQWILVGPASTSGQGTSGAIVETVRQNDNVTDTVVVKIYVEDDVVAIFSKAATFTPQTSIPGFTTIGPGLQMNGYSGTPTVSNALLRGVSTDSQTLDGIDSSGFLSATSNDTTTGTLGILNDGGLAVGADSDARISVTGTDVYIRNQTQNGNLYFQVNDGGATTTILSVEGSTSVVTMPTVLSVGNITNSNANGVGNIGSSTTYFNTVFAKATSAQYADVAERFAADEELLPGTVVELGGIAEITKSSEDLSEKVFGVISTRAAYLMNSAAGTDATHPPVAMTGRVPVRVVGKVAKGDRLVSAGNGLARAALPGEATSFNVIGRALEDKISVEESFVEAIVATK